MQQSTPPNKLGGIHEAILMKILVTGSDGFVGKELSRALLQRGHEVSGFDIAGGQDILNRGQARDAVKGMHAVYHLAAQLDEGAGDLFKVNVQGTKNMIEACAEERIQQFIFLSTAGVMGDLKKGLRADESTPMKPVTRYEKSKAEAEKIVLRYQEALPVTIVRSALVLGPNSYWKDIVEQIVHGFPMVGNGENAWQVIFCRDLVDALVFLLGREDALGETFIAAERRGMTLRELHDEIRRQAGITEPTKTISPLMAKAAAWIFSTTSMLSGKRTVIMPSHIDRLVRERNYSTAKINALGWEPKYSTKEAIRETLQALGKKASN